MWLGGIHCHCCLSGFNNGILGSVFDNCSASPCVKPQRSPGHRSRPLAPVSAPRLQQLWGVKCPWPRRSQTSRGVPVPFATIACCDVWQANGGDTAWLLSPENSMTFQKRRRLWVLPLSSHSIEALQTGAFALWVRLLGISVGRRFFLFRCPIRNCWCRIHQIH